MKLTFLGHSAWLLEENHTSLLFDPFLTGNPLASKTPDEVQPQYILLTHAHGDHLGDTIDIARKNDSLVVTTHEIAEMLNQEGVKTHSLHIGGKFPFDFGFVKAVEALHGSGIPGGHAVGFVVKFFDRFIYHSGDTGLFGDMKIIGEQYPLDIALLPIGGNYTMDIEDAAIAASWLNAKTVIPMHYNTFDLIKADPHAFVALCNKIAPTSKVELLEPSQNYTL